MDSSNSLTAIERDCNALGGLFHIIINDLRNGVTNWDDLILKANKYHQQLKATIVASTAFLDSFQKIADLATTTRGGTKEIGCALTRLCLRHRSVEAKLKSFTNSLFDSFILPIQDRVEEWKRIIVQLDKDHSKEIKRLKQLKKKQQTTDTRTMSSFANTTFRIKRHPHRSKNNKNDFARFGSMYDMNELFESIESNKEKYLMLEEVERNYVRRALIEERSHYCLFFNYLCPVVKEEISMLQEVVHLDEVLHTLEQLTLDPYQLPAGSESVLNKCATLGLQYDETNSSSSTLYRSRKSSISSIASITSLSTDSISMQNCKSLSQPNMIPVEFRPKSIASQDSGFISHDYNVPNIGRLLISTNKNKFVPEVIANMKNGTGNCVLNKELVSQLSTLPKTCKSSQTSCKECLDGEYASTEQLYSGRATSTANSTIDIYQLSQQPIYANVNDDYHSSSTTFRTTNNSSDGSITPTNFAVEERQEPIYQSASMQQLNSKYRRSSESPNKVKNVQLSKSCPPKPPIRHSSTLSTASTKPSSNHTNNVPAVPTRIYVMHDNNPAPDFPPPPPEAYANYASSSIPNSNYIHSEQSIGNFRNSHDTLSIEEQNDPTSRVCCDYSLPDTHLVMCNNVHCLKGITYNNNNKGGNMLPYTEQCTYVAPKNEYSTATIRKSYAFEGNQPVTICNEVTTGRQVNSDQCSVASSSNCRYTGSPPIHENECAKSTTSRRFHSTINLSRQ